MSILKPQKPCPFCGARPYSHVVIADTGHRFIYCIECGAHGPHKYSMSDAVKGWEDRSNV